MKKNSIAYRVAVIVGLAAGAFAISALADWTPAPANPPSNNTPPPIQQIGYTAQSLPSGLLVLKSLMLNPTPSTSNVTPGAVLSALDSSGNVGWTADALVNQACPSGQYVSGIDASGSIVCSSSSVVQYYFGGMYAPGVATNPLAGNTSGCPTGYTAYAVWGGANIDNLLYLCLAFSTSGASKVAEFGGMYGTYTNPLDGNARGCPSGYTPSKATGITGTDSLSYYCYSTTATPVITAFGGMWGGDGVNYTHKNPVTGLKNCPPSGSGWKDIPVLFSAGVDAPLHWCYLP